MVRRNRRYDFGNRVRIRLNMILDALTRSIPDNGGGSLTLTADRSVTTPKESAPEADRPTDARVAPWPSGLPAVGRLREFALSVVGAPRLRGL
jgi:hypothetical protein